MSFSEKFEAHVNDNMGGQSSSPDTYDGKGKAPLTFPTLHEDHDSEFSEKKGLKIDAPPRFSTIFGPAQTPAPALPPREFESYPQPKRRSGIFIATPVFWALLAIFLFESAALFAYTVIGLINNMPSTLVHTSVAPVIAGACNCATQPAINIAPNFLIQPTPQQGTVTATVTISNSQSSTSSPSTSTSAATSSADTTSAAAAIASQIAGLLHSQSTPSTSVPPVTMTVNPPAIQETVKSTTVLTVDPSGNTLQPRPTVTSTKVINESEASALASSATSVAASSTSTNATVSSITQLAATDATPSFTSSHITAIAMTTEPPTPEATTLITSSTATSSTQSANCIGAMGRMGNVNLCRED